MFDVRFADSALEDLRHFRPAEQKLLVDTAEQQLKNDPLTPTRNRKPLRQNDLSRWELRVGAFRIFYDVDEQARQVKVKAVGQKDHNRLLSAARSTCYENRGPFRGDADAR